MQILESLQFQLSVRMQHNLYTAGSKELPQMSPTIIIFGINDVPDVFLIKIYDVIPSGSVI